MRYFSFNKFSKASKTSNKFRWSIIIGGIALAILIIVGIVAMLETSGGQAANPKTKEMNYRNYADAGIAVLQAMYNEQSGLWDFTGWWNSANALEAVIDYSARTNSTAYLDVIANTFKRNSFNHFLNEYYDDEGWWALAWLKSYDLTKDSRYLDAAKTIFDDMQKGWDETKCGGGVFWKKDAGGGYTDGSKNAIPNELFLLLAVRLHQRTPGNSQYLQWAMKEWNWFAASGMINSQNLINDGLDNNCRNNNLPTFTYNQGVIIGGLVELYKVTNDGGYLTKAQAIADATIKNVVYPDGILREPCEGQPDACGADAPQFKGIFMRNLLLLYRVTKQETYANFIQQNADAIWQKNRNADNQFGLVWNGPFDQPDAARQSSALDCLIAAML